MRERLLEIWGSMRRNRLRTVLTGFAVAWGIFMLVILLGAGNGLKHAVLANFDDMATNTIEIYGGWTSVPYGGYEKDRRILLRSRDAEILVRSLPQITGSTASARYAERKMTRGSVWIDAAAEGATPEKAVTNNIRILEGRFINPADINLRRKVIVIDRIARDALFPSGGAVGTTVELEGIPFTVVGFYDSPAYYNRSYCYVPFSTGQLLYNQGRDILTSICLTVSPGPGGNAESERMAAEIRQRLASEHGFSPDDRSALWIYDNNDSYRTVGTVFGALTMFIWMIGIGTLTAGIVGVSNIMLVTVRERTSEFGIRKALGAKPSSITGLILTEAVIITALFGYIGMTAGVGVMEAVGYYADQAAASQEFPMFTDPTPDLSVAVSATVVLVIAGLVAGWIPARRAARLKTVDALRFNK